MLQLNAPLGQTAFQGGKNGIALTGVMEVGGGLFAPSQGPSGVPSRNPWFLSWFKSFSQVMPFEMWWQEFWSGNANCLEICFIPGSAPGVTFPEYFSMALFQPDTPCTSWACSSCPKPSPTLPRIKFPLQKVFAIDSWHRDSPTVPLMGSRSQLGFGGHAENLSSLPCWHMGCVFYLHPNIIQYFGNVVLEKIPSVSVDLLLYSSVSLGFVPTA